MNAVIYVRVSTDEQIKGTSLETQLAACREYARQQRFTVVKIFVEEGESAKFSDRTQLILLLDFCKNKKNGVEFAVFWKLDRFTRDNDDYCHLIKPRLRIYGVRVRSATEAIDETPAGKFMENMLVSVAQLDNETRAVRSVLGMQQRIKEGIFPWNPPPGYLAPKIGKKTEPDRPDPACFEQLQNCWLLLGSGGYSKADLVRRLSQMRVRTGKGRPFTPQMLDRIFRNRYYMGRIQNPWTGEEVIGRHEAMVSEETFARVQLVLKGRANSQPHHIVREEFPLRGLVLCSSCSTPMTGAWTTGKQKKYAYYECQRRGCSQCRRSSRADDVHKDFLSFLTEVALPTHHIPVLTETIRNVAFEQTASIRASAEQRKQQVESIKRKQDQLLELRASQLISDAEFVTQRDRYRGQLTELQADQADSSEWPLSQREASDLANGLSRLPEVWDDLAPDERRVFGRCLFPKGFVNQQTRTSERGLVFRLAAASPDEISDLVRHAFTNSNTLFAEIRRFLAIVSGPAMPQKSVA